MWTAGGADGVQTQADLERPSRGRNGRTARPPGLMLRAFVGSMDEPASDALSARAVSSGAAPEGRSIGRGAEGGRAAESAPKKSSKND